MRLFTAIELPESAREHLIRIQNRLHEMTPDGVSRTRGENLHLTLKFIGEISDDRIDALCRALREVSVEPMQLRTGGIVLFPPRGPVRIIACGFAGEVGAAQSLQEQIEKQCEGQGIAREGRRYIPHVTLARARHPLSAATRDELLRVEMSQGPKFECGHFVLMQSHLESAGARYVVVARFGQA